MDVERHQFLIKISSIFLLKIALKTLRFRGAAPFARPVSSAETVHRIV